MGVMAQLHADRCTIDRVLAPTVHRRDIAVAALVGNCEAIAASGLLPEPAEQSLRLLIAETLSAFNMEPHQAAITREITR